MIYVLLLLLLILLSVIVLPIGVEWDYSERKSRWYLVWLWILLPVPRWVRRTAENAARRRVVRGFPSKQKPPEELKEKGSVAVRISETIDGMRGGVEFFQRGVNLLNSVSTHFHVKVKRLDVTVATPNPALTGFTMGMMYAFAGAWSRALPSGVSVDFTRTRPEIAFSLKVTIAPVTLIPSGLKFAWFAWRKHRISSGDKHD